MFDRSEEFNNSCIYIYIYKTESNIKMHGVTYWEHFTTKQISNWKHYEMKQEATDAIKSDIKYSQIDRYRYDMEITYVYEYDKYTTYYTIVEKILDN
jgi:hypothetical protein